MNHTQQLAARRSALIARSALLREDLARLGSHVRDSLSGVDRGLGLARAVTGYAAGHPLLIAALAGVLTVWRPTKAFKWIARAALVRSVFRRALELLTRPPP